MSLEAPVTSSDLRGPFLLVNRRIVLSAVIAAAAVVPFLNGLGNEFLTWDDNIIILGQPFLRGLTLENLWHIFSPVPAREEWLPLRDLSLALNFSIFGADPAWFLVGNVILHAAASIAAFFVFERLCGSRPAAFIGALLFATHAAHVESVTWLSGRKDPLSTLFLLLSLLAYIRYRNGEGSFLPALGAFVAALLSKANGYVFPIWLVSYDLLYHRGLGWKQRLLPVVPFGALAFGHLLIYLHQTRLDGVIEPYPEGGLWTVLLTDVVLLRDYVLAVVFPLHHQAIYEVSFIRSPWNFAFLSSLGMLAALAHAGWTLRRRAWVPFVGALFFVNLLPYMNLVPHGIYYAERYLYLPSLSFALCLGAVLHRILELPEHVTARRVARWSVAAVLVGYLSLHLVVTWSRNSVWADSETFWSYQATALPENPAPLMNLGETYEILGLDERARTAYEKVVYREEGVLPEALYRLARIARRQEDLERSMELYAAYSNLVPTDPRALNNIAEILLASGRSGEAVALYRRVIRDFPGYLLARANLARALESQGRPEEALEHWAFIVGRAELLPQMELVEEAHRHLKAMTPSPSGR